jgi:hypothetical protein
MEESDDSEEDGDANAKDKRRRRAGVDWGEMGSDEGDRGGEAGEEAHVEVDRGDEGDSVAVDVILPCRNVREEIPSRRSEQTAEGSVARQERGMAHHTRKRKNEERALSDDGNGTVVFPPREQALKLERECKRRCEHSVRIQRYESDSQSVSQRGE